MSDDTYNGWTNRETWALVLWIENDEGWHEQISELVAPYPAHEAADLIKESVESLLDPDQYLSEFGQPQPTEVARVAYDIGSLYRVDWAEVAETFAQESEAAR